MTGKSSRGTDHWDYLLPLLVGFFCVSELQEKTLTHLLLQNILKHLRNLFPFFLPPLVGFSFCLIFASHLLKFCGLWFFQNVHNFFFFLIFVFILSFPQFVKICFSFHQLSLRIMILEKKFWFYEIVFSFFYMLEIPYHLPK